MEKNNKQKKRSKQLAVSEIELPQEILELILSFLDTIEDITAWTVVSKRFNQHIRNNETLQNAVDKYIFTHGLALPPINNRLIQIAMAGPGAAGKTSSAIKFANPDASLEQYDPTIEDSDRVKVMIDGEEYTVYILDHHYGEFQDISSYFQANIHGIYTVYSVISGNALDEAKSNIEIVQKWKNASNFPLLIAGNKIDLEQQRIITPEEGQKFADEHNALYFETSAKRGTNLNEAFMALIKRIVDVHKHKTRSLQHKSTSKRECSIM